jgi:hypothetical protein
MPDPDIHWRPAGWQITRCGAPHVPAQQFPAQTCCRTDPGQVTCPACKRHAAAEIPAAYLQIGGREPGLYIDGEKVL